jgi:hypothetical protein
MEPAARQTSDRPTFSQATPRAAACPINGVPLTDTAEQSFGDFPIHPDIVAALADPGSPARSRSRR